ncbi:hypothetical protein Sya03_30510 [Spirilliplanes yamanashiensis]|uniref:WD40 repeat protein n=1 Tax=Spirilliplanes yamanashiensis TaxID=42233 RepID=A0A8J3Y997_9ACTN|nr:hypothetical protein Sya03_30510 [Spirilliplanes yamanashiensis]
MWASGLVVSAVVGGLVAGYSAFPTSSLAAVSPGATVRVSVTDAGEGLPGSSYDPSVSADGRWVAFSTTAPLDPADDDGDRRGDLDVYVRDTVNGRTRLVSHGVGGTAVGTSALPSISGDGRYIAFWTDATNIPADAPRGRRIVVCDRDPDGDGTFGDGCAHTVVSGSDYDPVNPHISADGSLVSYEVPQGTIGLLSSAPNAAAARKAPNAPAAAATPDPGGNNTPGPGGSNTPDPGGSNTPSPTFSPSPSPSPSGPVDPEEPVDDTFGDYWTGWIELVSLSTDDAGRLRRPLPEDHTVVEAPGALTVDGRRYTVDHYADSTLAAGGGHVAFVARYEDADPERFATRSAVFDHEIGTESFVRLDVAADGTPLPGFAREAGQPALSGDGSRYAYVDRADRDAPVVRAYDRDADDDGVLTGDGVALPTEVASRTTAGRAALGGYPAFSADGRYLAFATPSLGTHNGVDTARDELDRCLSDRDSDRRVPSPSHCDVVVRDLVVDAARAEADLPRLPGELVSASLREECGAGETCEGDGHSVMPVLTADGSAVAFASEATDLVAGDANKSADVFLRRFEPALAAEPVDLGTVPLGSSALADVPVRHTGFGPLAVAEIVVEGAHATDFAVFPAETCTAQVLHVTGQCVVSVRFQPTAVGPRTATVRLVPVRGAPLDIVVTGVGAPAPTGGFTALPAGLDFGARAVLHQSPVRPVTVTNTGDGPLTIGAVTLAGANPGDYRITADTCRNRVVAVDATCRIDVRHQPRGVGDRPAVLRVDHSATLSHTVPLTGAGSAPTLTPSPTVVKSGDVIRLNGANFPPGGTVRLGFRGLPADLTVKAAADGSFSTPFVVMAHVETGLRPMLATATAAGLAAPLEAEAELLVTRGSLQPPDFIFRN